MNHTKKAKGRTIFLIVWIGLILLLLLGILILAQHPTEHAETVKQTMRDGVLHEVNKISLFGLEVNPALISAYVVTAVLLLGLFPVCSVGAYVLSYKVSCKSFMKGVREYDK